ncbi:hypothetical protein HNY73_005332 [Argiope bruennichi]|uniref:Uncharacterized protein n=1 Tax=Argiope bruennichi TaxID=94029 RepID=A0A8T0FLL4_ARGBR|nr:hypothetical protein HNY73_005332 [Argiope bruennichi]
MANESLSDMERFAFDIFSYTMLKAKYPSKSIPAPDVSPDFSSFLRRVYLYQTLRRNIWIQMFEARYKSDGFKKFKQISDFLHSTLSGKTSVKMAATLIVESLSFINELILFLCSKNCDLYLYELARFWGNYFATLEKHIGSKYLLTALLSPLSYKEELKPRVNCVTPFKSAKNIVIEKECFNHSTLNSKPCSNNLKSKKHIVTSKTSSTELLKNPGLGIRPHEELLLEFYGIMTNVEETRKMSNMPLLDYGASMVSSKVNAKLSGNSSIQKHLKQTNEHGCLPVLPVVVSRLEQKRQKVRAAYAEKCEQKIKLAKLVPSNERP